MIPLEASHARWGPHTGVLSIVPDMLDELNSALDQWRMARQFDSAEIVPGDGPPYVWTVKASRGDQVGQIVLSEAIIFRSGPLRSFIKICVETLDGQITAAETARMSVKHLLDGREIPRPQRAPSIVAPRTRLR